MKVPAFLFVMRKMLHLIVRLTPSRSSTGATPLYSAEKGSVARNAG